MTGILRVCTCAIVVVTMGSTAGGVSRDAAVREPRRDGSAAQPEGCSPVSGGTDSFPSTANLVINDQGFGEPFVVRVSSVDHPDGLLQRDPQIGGLITVELVGLELSGYHPRIGPVTLRESPSQPSLGQISNVGQDETCQFATGDLSLDLFVELELPFFGETWYNPDPIHLEGQLTSLPAEDVPFEVPLVDPVLILDDGTGEERGELFYMRHHVDPSFPPPGSDCYDALLTADLELFEPGETVNLFGFGPMSVLRGPVDPGGTCVDGGNPCMDDLDCSGSDTCNRSQLDTEIVAMDVGGFDALIGSWTSTVLPEAGDSNCCVPHPTPGCSDPDCEGLICDADPFCCESTWDILCANLAASEPSCAENCVDPQANPTFGTIESVGLDRTYPATSEFALFARIDTNLEGSLHNGVPIPLTTSPPLTNVPPDPLTEYTYLGLPIQMLDEAGTPAGRISNVVYQLQPPLDCTPPPGAAEDCFDGRLDVELTLPSCTTEALSLEGSQRVLRDDPRPGVALGQDIVDSAIAYGQFGGAGPCSGSVTVRLSSSSVGAVSSLTPEEFFPADSAFDVQVEVETGLGVLAAGPALLSTSINALPPPSGEIHFGPGTTLELLDGSGEPSGEIVLVALETQAPIECPAGVGSAIVFAGPSRDDLDVSVPGSAAPLDYDVVRGDLGALIASGGDFGSATCLATDVGPSVTDSDIPPAGDGFYYVARDGLGAFNGTWNGPGPAQQGDRDAVLPSCP